MMERSLRINKLFDMRPYSIVQRFGLKNPVFLPTASYGHFGRDSYSKTVDVYYEVPGKQIQNCQWQWEKNISEKS